MTERIKPLAYDEDGYSFVCKACMARGIVDGSVSELDRNLSHVFREMESLIKASRGHVAVKVRKRAGLDIRREKIAASLDHLLGAFYEVWADLEHSADDEKATVKRFRKDRSKGAAAKLANDPTQIARGEAIKLWPAAARKGMTAIAFHTKLTDMGHKVRPDTVRKWVTQLRKTGTC